MSQNMTRSLGFRDLFLTKKSEPWDINKPSFWCDKISTKEEIIVNHNRL